MANKPGICFSSKEGNGGRVGPCGAIAAPVFNEAVFPLVWVVALPVDGGGIFGCNLSPATFVGPIPVRKVGSGFLVAVVVVVVAFVVTFVVVVVVVAAVGLVVCDCPAVESCCGCCDCGFLLWV